MNSFLSPPRGHLLAQFLVPVLALSVVGMNARADGSEDAEGGPALTLIKGYSWGWTGRRGEYAGPEAEDSMRRLAATGADTACIAFATYMLDAHTPDFAWGDENPRMVSDNEIRRAISLARQNRMRVILKPVINCCDGTWRAWIKFHRPLTLDEKAAGITGHLDRWRDEPAFVAGVVPDEARWATWWENYSQFILHYARLAQEQQVEMLCLGCEMSSTEEFEDRWRRLIAEVRSVYSGAITYNCNHGNEQSVTWWDAVDVISISAYYAVEPAEGVTEKEATEQTTSVEEISAELEQVKAKLAKLSEKWNRPILFIETGAISARGSARHPWAHNLSPVDHPTDEQEQANYYQAMFAVFYNEPWFLGYAWWDWPARLYPEEEAPRHRGFCIFGKQAERVLREWYARPRNAAEYRD